MKIAVSTGGGDCPGLNAMIRAVVKTARLKYGDEVYGIRDSFNGLMDRPLDVFPLNLEDVSEILDRGGTILGTTNAGDPFKPGCDKSKNVVDAYKELGFDAIIVIGGDGTQTIANKFVNQGLNIIGIPKTIDNDLAATDISIGFNTAVDVVTDALGRLRSTAESHQRVMVLEVMGRDAGHIALHAGIAGGANTVLIPEIPFDYDAVIKKMNYRKGLGRYYSIVVVAEGAYEKGAKAIYLEDSAITQSNSKNLGGIGTRVARELHERTGMETRISVLGHMQRGGTPSPIDRVLGSVFGSRAVDLVHQKKFGVVVGWRKGDLIETPYSKVADISQPLQLDSPYIRTAESIGICLGR